MTQQTDKPFLNINRKSLTTWLVFIILGLFAFIIAMALSSEKTESKEEPEIIKKSAAWQEAEATARETMLIIDPTATITATSDALETAIEQVGREVRVQGWVQYRASSKSTGQPTSYHRVYQATVFKENDSIFFSHFSVDGTPRLGVVSKPPF